MVTIENPFWASAIASGFLAGIALSGRRRPKKAISNLNRNELIDLIQTFPGTFGKRLNLEKLDKKNLAGIAKVLSGPGASALHKNARSDPIEPRVHILELFREGALLDIRRHGKENVSANLSIAGLELKVARIEKNLGIKER